MVRGVRFDVHTLLYAGMAVLLGFQSVVFAFLTKVFAVSEGLMPEESQLEPPVSVTSRWKAAWRLASVSSRSGSSAVCGP
jgi:hypothetical protein